MFTSFKLSFKKCFFPLRWHSSILHSILLNWNTLKTDQQHTLKLLNFDKQTFTLLVNFIGSVFLQREQTKTAGRAVSLQGSASQQYAEGTQEQGIITISLQRISVKTFVASFRGGICSTTVGRS